MQNWAVVAVSVVAILVMLVAFSVVHLRMLPAGPRARSLLVSAACSATGVASWLLLAPLIAPGVFGELYLPIAALGGVAALLATITVRASGAGLLAALAFGALWSTIVFVPTAVYSLAPFIASGPLGIEPVDHGGSIAVNVGAGAAALGVLLAMGQRAPRLRAASLGLGWGVPAVIALCAGWLAWLVGAELAIDDLAPGILVNGVVGALGGVAGWLVVQRISRHSTTLSAVAAGLVSGLVSVTAGAPLFTPVSAAAAGVLAGAAACIFTLGRVGASRRQQWFIVGSNLVAGAVGIVLLGLLATDIGFLFTGQVTFIQYQVVGTVLAAGYSAAVSFLLWTVLKRVPVRASAPPGEAS